jgi:hypothetical protein
MRVVRLTLNCAAAALTSIAMLLPAQAAVWMSEAAMRGAFIGRTLDGHYGNGQTWTETYFANGRLDYREPLRGAVGDWFFRGQVFCTFYDPGQAHALSGGCWHALKASTNCYEFYLATDGDDLGSDETGVAPHWTARGWRRGEPATCEEPSV